MVLVEVLLIKKSICQFRCKILLHGIYYVILKEVHTILYINYTVVIL